MACCLLALIAGCGGGAKSLPPIGTREPSAEDATPVVEGTLRLYEAQTGVLPPAALRDVPVLVARAAACPMEREFCTLAAHVGESLHARDLKLVQSLFATRTYVCGGAAEALSPLCDGAAPGEMRQGVAVHANATTYEALDVFFAHLGSRLADSPSARDGFGDGGLRMQGVSCRVVSEARCEGPHSLVLTGIHPAPYGQTQGARFVLTLPLTSARGQLVAYGMTVEAADAASGELMTGTAADQPPVAGQAVVYRWER